MSIDTHFYVRLLRSCSGHRSISTAKQLHVLFLKSGLISSVFLSNSLLQAYVRSPADGGLPDARRLFDEMPQRSCFSYNSLIDAYLKSNDAKNSLRLFESMPERNDFSWNTIITGLARIGDLDNATKLFDEMPTRDAVACNSMIHAYIRSGRAREAFELYKWLVSDSAGPCAPCHDGFVIATVVSACADCRLLDLGKQIHGRLVVARVEMDFVLASALVDMYGKCKDLDAARVLLDLMKEPDEFSLSALISGYAGCGRVDDAKSIFDCRNNPSVVLWNSMINGYALNGQAEEALHLFARMRREGICADASTFASVISASSCCGVLANGRQLHVLTLKLGFLADIVIASALLDSYSKFGVWEDACGVFAETKVQDTILLNTMINVYSNCGRIKDARAMFDSIPRKSLISWNSMIVGYSQNSCAVEALELFCKMHQLDLRPDKVALASAVSAAASVSLLTVGEVIFALSTIIGLDGDQIVATSLIDLYCKCGKVSNGQRLFDRVTKPDEALWNTMLMGYATNGYGFEVLKLFEAMRDAGVPPNEVTLIAVLSGCCHCGLVEEGLKWFHVMKKEYGIEPVVEHYSCIVDLFVRAGRLEEAVEFIDGTPFQDDASMWTSVLGGCKSRGNEMLGRRVAERLVRLNPQQCGAYVQLSCAYAAHGEWQRSMGVRRMMQEKKISKNPGCSWIDC